MRLIFRILYFASLSLAGIFVFDSCNKDKAADELVQPEPLPSWHIIHTIDSTAAINSIRITDVKTIWMTGDSGRIFKSADGGTNWITEIHPGNDLNKVFFTNNQKGWICGSKGLILATSNANTWDTLPSGTSADLYDILFVSENEGWTVGAPGVTSDAVILHTADGGLSWTPQISGTDNLLNSVFCLDTLGWICGSDGTILRTENKGNLWVKVPLSYTNNLNKIVFRDKNTGYIVGSSGLLMKSTDGGINWTSISVNTLSDLYDIFFLDSMHLWISGENGKVIRSEDGGVTWSVMNTNTDAYIFGIAFSETKKGVAAGVTKSNKGILIKYQ